MPDTTDGQRGRAAPAPPDRRGEERGGRRLTDRADRGESAAGGGRPSPSWRAVILSPTTLLAVSVVLLVLLVLALYSGQRGLRTQNARWPTSAGARRCPRAVQDLSVLTSGDGALLLAQLDALRADNAEPTGAAGGAGCVPTGAAVDRAGGEPEPRRGPRSRGPGCITRSRRVTSSAAKRIAAGHKRIAAGHKRIPESARRRRWAAVRPGRRVLIPRPQVMPARALPPRRDWFTARCPECGAGRGLDGGPARPPDRCRPRSTRAAVPAAEEASVVARAGKGWRVAPAVLAIFDQADRLYPAGRRRSTGPSATPRTRPGSATTTRATASSSPVT